MPFNHSEIKNFNFPLIPGKQWTFRYSRSDFGFPASDTDRPTEQYDGKVAAEVRITEPNSKIVKTTAGQFDAIEIRRSEQTLSTETTYYYSPNTKSVVKLTVDLPDARAKGELIDRIELELIKYGHKEIVVQAPVYEEGDWWVFRTKAESPSGKISLNEYRVTYNNGRFESDPSGFLTQSDDPEWPNNYPFASVYVNDPEIISLNFPLVTGKEWKFRFRRNPAGSGSPARGHAEAKVIGPVAEDIETPAGRFKAIEIRRRDFRNSTLELLYFYSAETKSVVKSTTHWSLQEQNLPRRFEMELIEFGHKEPVVQAPIYEEGDWWVYRVKRNLSMK